MPKRIVFCYKHDLDHKLKTYLVSGWTAVKADIPEEGLIGYSLFKETTEGEQLEDHMYYQEFGVTLKPEIKWIHTKQSFNKLFKRKSFPRRIAGWPMQRALGYIDYSKIGSGKAIVIKIGISLLRKLGEIKQGSYEEILIDIESRYWGTRVVK